MHTKETLPLAVIGLLLASVVVSGFNTYQMAAMTHEALPSHMTSAGMMPAGIPAIYGQELGVSYSDVREDNPAAADATIRRLAALDQQLTLDAQHNARYVRILLGQHGGISCEYCCGAAAIIFNTGEPACGCAHSYAMRGLAKYLITEHADEYTDDEIFEELSKWKMLFFPTQMSQKASVLEQKGIEPSYTNIASNEFRGIERQAGGGMVGGC